MQVAINQSKTTANLTLPRQDVPVPPAAFRLFGAGHDSSCVHVRLRESPLQWPHILLEAVIV